MSEEFALSNRLCQQSFHIPYNFLTKTLPRQRAIRISLTSMNLQAPLPNVRFAHRAPAPARNAKDISRFLILNQVVAGILWMSLDLPRNVSRQTIEALAHQLIARIRAGAAEPAIEAELTLLYSQHFYCRADIVAIHNVVRRAANIVRGSSRTLYE